MKNDNTWQEKRRLSKMDELDWIQYRKQESLKKLRESKQNLSVCYERLTKRDVIPSDKWGRAVYILTRGATILSGLRIGFTIGKVITTITKIKKTFSKK